MVDTRSAVVVAAGKQHIAFYQSTGTGTPGMVESGEWVPFGGVIPGWIIKAKDAKIPKGRMTEISQWLTTQNIGGPEHVFDVTDWKEINAFLKKHDALCKLDSAVFTCKLPKAPTTKRKAAKPKPTRKKTMAKKKDREGLFDPKHYWARRVKAKYTYRGGKSQYPEKIGDWTTDESWYDAEGDGNRTYETESASFFHPSGANTAIYHHSGPEGETWDLESVSYPTLRAAIAALKSRSGRARRVPPKKRKAAPKKRTARKPAAKSSRSAADYFSMGSADLVALGDAGAKKELKRRGRDPRTGKKVRR